MMDTEIAVLYFTVLYCTVQCTYLHFLDIIIAIILLLLLIFHVPSLLFKVLFAPVTPGFAPVKVLIDSIECEQLRGSRGYT